MAQPCCSHLAAFAKCERSSASAPRTLRMRFSGPGTCIRLGMCSGDDGGAGSGGEADVAGSGGVSGDEAILRAGVEGEGMSAAEKGAPAAKSEEGVKREEGVAAPSEAWVRGSGEGGGKEESDTASSSRRSGILVGESCG